jgi:hypothetical protein
LQTIGAALLLWHGVPLYREVAADPSTHKPRPEVLVWTLISIALIQIGYWSCYRTRPPMPHFSNALLGHVVRFLDQMSFVFVTSVFCFAFVTKNAGFDIPPFHSVVIILALFSLYCYIRELESLGSSFESRKSANGMATRPEKSSEL